MTKVEHSSFSSLKSYTRLITLLLSWYFSTDQSEVFMGMFLFQLTLGVVQLLFTNIETESANNKHLRVLTGVISTSIILFATIRQALDHSKNSKDPEVKYH